MSAPDPQVETYNRRLKRWANETHELRAVLRDCGLTESLKWGKPCFSLAGGNVAIIQPFKPHLALMFFKGQLLKDPRRLLVSQGPNSQAARRLEFTSLEQLAQREKPLRALVKEALRVEKSGARVDFKEKTALELPAELTTKLKADPALAKAFKALTPGRQRAYVLFISGAKQSATRAARVEKHVERIRAGLGLNDV